MPSTLRDMRSDKKIQFLLLIGKKRQKKRQQNDIFYSRYAQESLVKVCPVRTDTPCIHNAYPLLARARVRNE